MVSRYRLSTQWPHGQFWPIAHFYYIFLACTCWSTYKLFIYNCFLTKRTKEEFWWRLASKPKILLFSLFQKGFVGPCAGCLTTFNFNLVLGLVSWTCCSNSEIGPCVHMQLSVNTQGQRAHWLLWPLTNWNSHTLEACRWVDKACGGAAITDTVNWKLLFKPQNLPFVLFIFVVWVQNSQDKRLCALKYLCF